MANEFAFEMRFVHSFMNRYIRDGPKPKPPSADFILRQIEAGVLIETPEREYAKNKIVTPISRDRQGNMVKLVFIEAVTIYEELKIKWIGNFLSNFIG